MKMDEGFLEAHYLDFYASFANGTLGHFATAGQGFVPESVRYSINNYELICDCIYLLGENTGFIIIDSNIPNFITPVQRERYLESFSVMARKGFFSYDYRGDCYKLIAAPQASRHISEMPEHIGFLLASLSLASNEDISVIESHLFI